MMEHRTTWTCSWMKPVCLYIALYNSSEGLFFSLHSLKGLLWFVQICLFHHLLYPCSHSPQPLNVPLSVCSSPVFPRCFYLSTSFIVLPSLCKLPSSLVPFYSICSSHQKNVLLPHIHSSLRSDPSPTSFYPSLPLSDVTPSLPASLQR